MTTSSPNLNQLKDQALNSYIEFTPGERELIEGAKSFDEFDKIMHTLVAKYNDHPIK